jgi:hypothetical protein
VPWRILTPACLLATDKKLEYALFDFTHHFCCPNLRKEALVFSDVLFKFLDVFSLEPFHFSHGLASVLPKYL